MILKKQLLCPFILMLPFAACHNIDKKQQQPSSIQFTSLASSKTNITFNNTIVENDSVNLIENEYAYMGGGVGIGDFNNDGLPDVFFTANQASCKLYINKGNMQFEDVTQKAGLETNFWATGVSIVDINNDGYDDIYVCAAGSKDPNRRKNKLYINNGNLTFTEEAAEYGLADTGFSTQAAFFDYDGDGDLDMYLVNHVLYQPNANQIVARNLTGSSPATDKLYRNEGTPAGGKHPIYKDVSLAAGIKDDGYGLGVAVSDFNNDGWPDIYVTNDYIENDVLWLNNRNGTFSNCVASSLKHQSYSSMGVDAADINNDALPDILSLDMLAETNERKKMMYSFLNYQRYELERRAGYQPSFMRNMLQLNNGVRNVHDTMMPFFSEIGQLAGIQQTDWSWSVLLADFDNDGNKDIHITNGFGKNMLNNDFLAYRASYASAPGEDATARLHAFMKKLDEYGSRALNNYCFKNNGNLTFTNVSEAAGINTPSVSNGCAYADLDNDGDLDLIVNNINQPAFVLQNNVRENKADSNNHYISFLLKGDSLNKNGIGVNLKIYTGAVMQMLEQYPVRGYASTVDKRLHAGLGKKTVVDSVVVTWPGNIQQVLQNVPADRLVTIYKKDAHAAVALPVTTGATIFTDVTAEKNIDFTHKETFFSDYDFQRLLLHKYSQLGPFITTGDVNGDGLEDFFIGGAFHQPGKLFIQQANGGFIAKEIDNANKQQEDMGVLFFDADGDKDLDLIITGGSFEFDAGSPNYIPRLYVNDGKGNFSFNPTGIPSTINTSAQAVTAADYDGDGDLDLFIGGRVSVNNYPTSPKSYILRNDGGKFTDVTQDVCPRLSEPGMVTAALWTDFNGDKKPDLVIAGEWMPVRFFANSNGKLKEVTGETGLTNNNGFWRSLTAVDIDNDGDIDIVAGNLGLNNKYQADATHPVTLYATDIDNNGIPDPILGYYVLNNKGERELCPDVSRDMLTMQAPSIKKKFERYADYSTVTMDGLFAGVDKNTITKLTVEQTATCWFENKGNGKFVMHTLPVEAQLAPVNSIVCTDIDNDGNIDVIMAGNEYQSDVATGRYDASYGVVLKGDGKGSFTNYPFTKSGFIIDGDVKNMKQLTGKNNERLLLVGVNDDKLSVFKIK